MLSEFETGWIAHFLQRLDHATYRTRDLIGVECLLWGNDYPHHDSIWPRSQAILARILDGVPEAEVEAMVWSNTIDLYRIDAARLPAA